MLTTLVLLLPLLAGQDVDLEQHEAKLLAYLLRAPYHGPVFEEWATALAVREALEETASDLAQRAAEDPAHSVLQARLLARSGALDEALEILGELAGEAPAHRLLCARLELGRGDTESAAGWLAGWEQWADPRLARDGCELASLCARARGDDSEAAAAWVRLAERAPLDFELALEAGEALAAMAYPVEAAQLLRRAVTLAGDEVERGLRARVALGTALELALDQEGALTVWRAANRLLSREHWRKAEVRAHIVDLERIAGRFEDYLSELAARAQEPLAGPGELEEWVSALLVDRRVEAAAAALAGSAETFPEDRLLSELRLEVARYRGDHEERVRELQLQSAQRPGAVELWRALGDALLAAGRVESARGHWQRYLQARPEDVGARVAAAEAFAQGRDREFALELLREAHALEPRDQDLVQRLARLAPEPSRTELLDEAAAGLEADPAQWLAWIERLRELNESERASALLKTASARFPGVCAVQLSYAADASSEELRQAALWRAAVAGDAQFDERCDALQSFVRALGDEARLSRRSSAERAALERDPVAGRDEPERWLLVAEIERRLRRRDAQLDALTRYVQLVPADVRARESLANQLGTLDHYEAALAQRHRLAELDPPKAFDHLLRAAQLCVEFGDRSLGRRSLEELIPRAARSAQRQLDLAELALELELPERARVLVGQAQANPGADAVVHERAARTRSELGDESGALLAYERAFGLGDEAQRARVVNGLWSLLQPRDRGPAQDGELLADYLVSLEERVVREPLEVDALWLLFELGQRSGDPALVRGALGELLRREPHNPSLLDRRAQLHADAGQSAKAARDLELALRVDLDSPPRRWTRLVEMRVQLADGPGALAAARAGGQPADNAEALSGRLPTLALQYLEEEAQRDSLEGRGWQLLGELRQAVDNASGARLAFEAALQRGQDSRELRARLYKACEDEGHPDDGLAHAYEAFVNAGLEQANQALEQLGLGASERAGLFERACVRIMEIDSLDRARRAGEHLALKGGRASRVAVRALQDRLALEDSVDAEFRDALTRAALRNPGAVRERMRSLRRSLRSALELRDCVEYLVLLPQDLRIWQVDRERVAEILTRWPSEPVLAAAALELPQGVAGPELLPALDALLAHLAADPELDGIVLKQSKPGSHTAQLASLRNERVRERVFPGLRWPSASQALRVALHLAREAHEPERATAYARAALDLDWPGLAERVAQIGDALDVGLVAEALAAAEAVRGRLAALPALEGARVASIPGAGSWTLRGSPSLSPSLRSAAGLGGLTPGTVQLSSGSITLQTLGQAPLVQLQPTGGATLGAAPVVTRRVITNTSGAAVTTITIQSGSSGVHTVLTGTTALQSSSLDPELPALSALAERLIQLGADELALGLIWQAATCDRARGLSRLSRVDRFLQRLPATCPRERIVAFLEAEFATLMQPEQLYRELEQNAPQLAACYAEELQVQHGCMPRLALRAAYISLARGERTLAERALRRAVTERPAQAGPVPGWVAELEPLELETATPNPFIQNTARSASLEAPRSGGRGLTGLTEQVRRSTLATPVAARVLLAALALERDDLAAAAAQLAALEPGALDSAPDVAAVLLDSTPPRGIAMVALARVWPTFPTVSHAVHFLVESERVNEARELLEQYRKTIPEGIAGKLDRMLVDSLSDLLDL